MSRSVSSSRHFLVTFNDGFQMAAYAQNEQSAIEYGDKYEKYYKEMFPKRPNRKAMKATLLSDDPEVRKVQVRDIIENNRRIMGRAYNKPRPRPKQKVKAKKEGHDQ